MHRFGSLLRCIYDDMPAEPEMDAKNRVLNVGNLESHVIVVRIIYETWILLIFSSLLIFELPILENKDIQIQVKIEWNQKEDYLTFKLYLDNAKLMIRRVSVNAFYLINAFLNDQEILVINDILFVF